jgi:hypothetical protein
MSERRKNSSNKNDDRHYLWIIISFLIVVGAGVIYLVYGASALILAIPVLLIGALLLLLPFYLIQFLGWLVKKIDKDN